MTRLQRPFHGQQFSLRGPLRNDVCYVAPHATLAIAIAAAPASSALTNRLSVFQPSFPSDAIVCLLFFEAVGCQRSAFSTSDGWELTAGYLPHSENPVKCERDRAHARHVRRSRDLGVFIPRPATRNTFSIRPRPHRDCRRCHIGNIQDQTNRKSIQPRCRPHGALMIGMRHADFERQRNAKGNITNAKLNRIHFAFCNLAFLI